MSIESQFLKKVSQLDYFLKKLLTRLTLFITFTTKS